MFCGQVHLFAGIYFHRSYINHISADMSRIKSIKGYFVAKLLQDGHDLKSFPSTSKNN